jgi:hypothetical protein
MNSRESMIGGFWHWVPGQSIGPFTFGNRADPYVRDYGLLKRPPACSIADWDTYELPGFGSWIIVENGRITEVHCVDGVEYMGRNLLGMDISEIRELLGAEEKKEDNVGLGYALYYDDLGLTLFLVDGVVSAAACGLILEDDDQ